MRAPLLLCFAALTIAACSKLTSPPSPEAIVVEIPPPPPSAQPVAVASASQAPPQPDQPPPPAGPTPEVKITDVVKGTGPEVKLGDMATVHYVGTLTNGTKFDASRDHGQPFEFQVGGRVIDGWNKGLPGMKVGGKRKLVIPWQLAYGEQGSPPKIPPKSDLVFEIELLKIGPPPLRH
jgi:FKBP-type peptidyl-prolyl cis-trans isomerase